jgi:hypothetical protein
MTPGQQAQVLVDDRGTVQSPVGYTQFPWNIHPNDRYRRVFPDGPFDRAWEGVQKINLMSSVGTRRASFYDPNIPVFNFETKKQYPRVQWNNQASHSFGGGPASIAAQEQEYQQTGQPPSFLGMVMSRLRGGS